MFYTIIDNKAKKILNKKICEINFILFNIIKSAQYCCVSMCVCSYIIIINFENIFIIEPVFF